MGFRWQDGGYSAEVQIYLIVDGRRLPVAQVGKDFLILREPADIPSGHAVLNITIDGNEQLHDIILATSNPATAELEFA
jgi:hypothetical protein